MVSVGGYHLVQVPERVPEELGPLERRFPPKVLGWADEVGPGLHPLSFGHYFAWRLSVDGGVLLDRPSDEAFLVGNDFPAQDGECCAVVVPDHDREVFVLPVVLPLAARWFAPLD